MPFLHSVESVLVVFAAGVVSGHVVVCWIKKEIAAIHTKIDAEFTKLHNKLNTDLTAVHAKFDQLLSRTKTNVFTK